MDNKSNLAIENYKEQIEVWYKAHNIIRERTELYCDFLLSLLRIIDETYLGDDILINDVDITNHFEWCYKKIIEGFEKEKIFFERRNGHFEYLWIFFYKAYYKSDNLTKYQDLTNYFTLLFSYNKPKTMPELESFIDLYKIFEQSLKKMN